MYLLYRDVVHKYVLRIDVIHIYVLSIINIYDCGA